VIASSAPAPFIINPPYKYTQNFNTLSKEDNTQPPFTQGETISSWWSNQDKYLVSDGSLNQAGLYSFGSKGSGDRALGAITSNSKKTVIFGFTFTTTVDVKEVRISFWGEQWRYGGLNVGPLNFDLSETDLDDYQNGGWGVNGSANMWKSYPSLFFYPIVNNTVGPTNDTNKVYLESVMDMDIPKDQVVQIRWTAKNSNDGLGVDDLEIVLVPSSVVPPQEDVPPHDIWKTLAIGSLSSSVILAVVAIIAIIKFVRLRRGHAYVEMEQPAAPGPNNLGVYALYHPNNRATLVANSQNSPQLPIPSELPLQSPQLQVPQVPQIPQFSQQRQRQNQARAQSQEQHPLLQHEHDGNKNCALCGRDDDK